MIRTDVNTSERLITEGWPSLTSAFEVAMNRLIESVENVHRHALLERTGIGMGNLEGQANNNRLFSMLTLNANDSSDFSCYSLPEDLPYFYGRSTEIAKISEHFEKSLAVDERRTFVLYGLGGSGKTSLARAYAQQCKDNKTYDAILWVKSQTIEDMQDSFVEIGHALGLSTDDGNKDPILRVKKWLSKTSKLVDCINELLLTYRQRKLGC
jgi:NB-ARC domain